MSIITHNLTKRIRLEAELFKECCLKFDIYNMYHRYMPDFLLTVANIIEMLGQKLYEINLYNQWTPVKWHNISEAERVKNEYLREWEILFDCPMPEDDQEILITIRSMGGCLPFVIKTRYKKEYRFSRDSELDWTKDILAWMPSPEPYQSEE